MTRQPRILIWRSTSLHSFRDMASHQGIFSNSLALPSFPGHWFHSEDIVMEGKPYQEPVRSLKMRLFPPMKKNLPIVSKANSSFYSPPPFCHSTTTMRVHVFVSVCVHESMQVCVYVLNPFLCTLYLSIKKSQKQYWEPTHSAFSIGCLPSEIAQYPSMIGLEIVDNEKRIYMAIQYGIKKCIAFSGCTVLLSFLHLETS